MAEPIEYTDASNEQWSLDAVTLFNVDVVPDIQTPLLLDLNGKCPRCKDDMSAEHWLVSFSGVTDLSRDEAVQALRALYDQGIIKDPPLPAEFALKCVCQMKHPDPFGRSSLIGCGAFWNMRFEKMG